MSIARDIFFAFTFMMLFTTIMSVTTSVGGCWWPIYAMAVIMDVSFWQLSNNPLNSVSVADSITFLTMLHYTCTGPFSGVISCIGVLDFFTRKKYPPALFRASGSDM